MSIEEKIKELNELRECVDSREERIKIDIEVLELITSEARKARQRISNTELIEHTLEGALNAANKMTEKGYNENMAHLIQMTTRTFEGILAAKEEGQ